MRAWVFVLAIAALFLLSPYAARAQTCEWPVTGDWPVNESIVCSGQTIVLNGSLLINGSGNLTLEDSKLQFNSSFDGQFGIESNGSLYIIRSAIENTSDSGKAYTFVSNPGAKLEIRDSEIHGCGYDGDYITKVGLYVASDRPEITNTTFSDNWIAINLQSNNSKITNNKILSNKAGLNAVGSGNLISGNIFDSDFLNLGNIYGDNVTLESNVIKNTISSSGTGLAIMSVNNSLINNNTFYNIGGGFRISGKNNNITNNNITSGINKLYPGIDIFDSEDTRVAGNKILDNVRGLSIQQSKNTLVKDNLCNRSLQFDIYMLSGQNTSFSNTNYTTLIKKWLLNVRVFDNASSPVFAANVLIMNNFTTTVFSGDTDSFGSITQQTLEERKENESGIFISNPYSINVTKSGYFGNFTAFSLTSDLYINMILIPVPAPPSSLVFNFTIQSPVNATYVKYNLTNGTLLKLAVTSDKNMSSCNYSIGNASGSLAAASPKSFQANINVSAMDGPYQLTFVCSSAENVTNASSVYFTVRPSYDCLSSNGCDSDQECAAYKCVDIQCICGYASNHVCIKYECCKDSECNDSEACNLGTHKCEAVLCECPEKIAGHTCNMQAGDGYCCSDMQCDKNETCITNKCVERKLSFIMPDSFAFGQNATLRIVDQDNKSVENVKVEVEYLDTEEFFIDIYYTDSNGEAQIEIKHAGRVVFKAIKGGYWMGSSDTEIPEPFNLIFILEIIVLVGASAGIVIIFLRFMKTGGLPLPGRGGPFRLEKTVSGNIVMLRIKNKTNKKMRDITVRDSVHKGAFIRCSIMPKIEPFDTMNNTMTWEILELGPKEEVTIEYETRWANTGFSVKCNEKEYKG